MITYYGIGYRKKVVLQNLRQSFPEKSEAEIQVLARRFFQHFCDVLIEAIKGFSITKEEILERHEYEDISILDEAFKEGRSVAIVGSHYCNWEWVAFSLPLRTKLKTYGIYQTLNNPYFDKIVKESRERYGMTLISQKKVGITLENEKNKNLITMGYITDQSPGRHSPKHWVKFLNQETAFISGFERFAKKHNDIVVFFHTRKIKRGVYRNSIQLITKDPNSMTDLELIQKYATLTEEMIRQDPAYYLWSHKRWKIKKEEN